MGRDHSLFIPSTHLFNTFLYSTSSHHPIIPSPHHPLFIFQALLLFSPYTITDLSFGGVPGENHALSPVILVDAGSTTKRSNSELSSGAVCGENLTHTVQKLGKIELNSELSLLAWNLAPWFKHATKPHSFQTHSRNKLAATREFASIINSILIDGIVNIIFFRRCSLEGKQQSFQV